MIRKLSLATLLLLALGVPAHREAEAAAAKDLDVHRFVLENGLTVLHVERDNLPVVRASLLVRAGATSEPGELSGLASLTASLLTEGTKARSSTEISQEVEFIGASLGASAGADFTTISLSVLRKDMEKGFELMSDVLLRPVFPRKEIKRRKAQVMGALKKRLEDPGYLAREKFNKLVYGGHPYARQVSGTEESIGRIGRGDIREFYTSRYRPNNAVLSVVGMVDPEELKGLIDKYLSGWPPAEVPRPGISAPESAGPGLRTIDRELTQATILMGHLGVPRLHPDYYALQVMNYILGGGGFSSRMMDRLRDQLGLTYGVHSIFSYGREAGSFMVNIKTKNISASKAIEEIRAIVSAMRKEGATAEELAAAKAYLTGSFPRRIDTMGEIASFLAVVEYYGLGLDYPRMYAERINAVTLKDVGRVAREHIREDDFITVVVARQSEAGLEAAAESNGR
jgi:zinc protease